MSLDLGTGNGRLPYTLGRTDDWKWDEELRRYHIDLTTSSDCILLSRKMAEEGFHDHWESVAANAASPQFAFANMKYVLATK